TITFATTGPVFPTRPSVTTKSDSTTCSTYPTSPSVTTKSDSTADASPPTAAATIFKFTVLGVWFLWSSKYSETWLCSITGFSQLTLFVSIRAFRHRSGHGKINLQEHNLEEKEC
ncbi:hypothetical protein MKX01_038580, partial [Papaver californicum]